MYGQVNESDTQRKKLIIISVVMGLIILFLAVVFINAIVRKNNNLVSKETASENVELEDNEENAEVSRAENSESSESSESAEAGNLAPVSNSSAVANAESSSSSSSNSALPSTGPREVVSLALLLGSVAMYLFSRAYKNELA